MTINQYIDSINQRYKLGNATEHTFRGDLQLLIESLVPTIRATNEPKRQKCGAPDYILTKKDIPIGFIEAKDIGDKDLDGVKKTGNKEQFDRYKESLNNLIFTDYLSFHIYRDGQFITKVSIAEVTDAGIKPLPENFATFTNLLTDFCAHISQSIKSSQKLAMMMAGKARLMADVIERALVSDEETEENSTLKDQMNAFKQILIHDITPKGFADVYAQTIAYGMFAARLHDPTLPTFSRQEAAELIPKSNPFLRKLFSYIAGPDIDDRIKWIVDSLVEIFLACNVEEILKNYGKTTKMEDPIIHFYETFLSEYDPKLRKARGVWYTPAPVVNFIVRAVDEILKTEFNLPQGLADSSKTKIKVEVQGKKIEQEVHKVQILDPATGTGTFLAEVVKHVHKKFKGQQGIWSNYVEQHLLPRLNGFELLMASYAMAHLQLDLLLSETGYKPTTPPYGHPSKGGESQRGGQRLRVYLTNSLEEHHEGTDSLFASWLSTEANEANHIKRDTPVMCVIGNPPYSVSSNNKSEWIESLTADYKKDLNERNIQPLSDDYIKFIRFGQHYIDKNGSGVLAYISNNSFLDGIIHRQMRKNLLESFDKIYILDLHGNAKKKEVCEDGTPDQNVFDIMQGVSINIFVKTGLKKKSETSRLYHKDLQGSRVHKYDFLNESTLNTIEWNKLITKGQSYFFVKKDFDESGMYEKGFKIDAVFNQGASGIASHRDSFVIDDKLEYLKKRIDDFYSLSSKELVIKYNLKETSEWQIEVSQNTAKNNSNYNKISYRPLDTRFIYYEDCVITRSRRDLMKHLLQDNIGIVTCKRQENLTTALVTKHLIDQRFFSVPGSVGKDYVFPLYLYPDSNGQQSLDQTTERTPNLNKEIVQKIADGVGLKFVPEKHVITTPTPPKEGNYGSTVPPKEGNYGSTESNFAAIEGAAKQKKSPPLEGCPQDGVDNERVVTAHINGIPIYRNFVVNLPYNSTLKQRAKEKRKAGILSEVLFWQQVHKDKFHGIDFDRQRIIGSYIVDFYVKTLGVVVEIDGSSHNDKQEYDVERQRFLEALGLKVFRVTDADVKKNMGGVMKGLEQFIIDNYGGQEEATPPFGHPSKGGEFSVSEISGGEYMSEEFAPIDILDYIYAVLHSPAYREKYKEFLKIDFPRVPYPKDQATFWKLVKLGGEIRKLHLLESSLVEEYITEYPIDGDNIVRKVRFQNSTVAEECPRNQNSPPLEGCPQDGVVKGQVYINETQYFGNVPVVAWEFYIGGYQPAQKWLKDRKDRKLEFDDIFHYQKMIVALVETERLMREIDVVGVETGE